MQQGETRENKVYRTAIKEYDDSGKDKVFHVVLIVKPKVVDSSDNLGYL